MHPKKPYGVHRKNNPCIRSHGSQRSHWAERSIYNLIFKCNTQKVKKKMKFNTDEGKTDCTIIKDNNKEKE